MNSFEMSFIEKYSVFISDTIDILGNLQLFMVLCGVFIPLFVCPFIVLTEADPFQVWFKLLAPSWLYHIVVSYWIIRYTMKLILIVFYCYIGAECGRAFGFLAITILIFLKLNYDVISKVFGSKKQSRAGNAFVFISRLQLYTVSILILKEVEDYMKVGELMGVVHPMFYTIVCGYATVCMHKYISMPFFLFFPISFVGF